MVRKAHRTPEFDGVAEFLSHAYTIEVEAEERYLDLAGQMETHNNTEVAMLFRKLAGYEGSHAEHILAMAPEMELPAIAPWEFKWLTTESPELVDLLQVHYLMRPHHALMLALAAEEAAFRFFDRVAQTTDVSEVRDLAREFAEEESEHIDMVRALLDRYQPAPADWDDDYDSAISQG